jgi:protein SCO1
MQSGRLALVMLTLTIVVPHATAFGDAFRSGVFEPPHPAAEFALPSTRGHEFRLSRHRGQVIVLTFGYTNCPDVCPTVLAELAQMRARLGGAGARVQVLYVSVDPERDTFERLRAYTEMFDRTFLGLGGSMDQLAPVWKAYGVSVARRQVPGSAPPTYFVHHTASVYLIDTAERLRVMALFGTPVDDVVHDVQLLLAESVPLRIEKAWVRRAPAPGQGTSMTAAYLTIINRGTPPDTLLSATADVAAGVELHETRNTEGMMTMERVPAIAVPPGGSRDLKPGGYHLMLTGLKRALNPGQTVVLTLSFERAGMVTARAAVR